MVDHWTAELMAETAEQHVREPPDGRGRPDALAFLEDRRRTALTDLKVL